MFGYFAVFYKRYRVFLALERSKFKLDDFVKTYVSFKELVQLIHLQVPKSKAQKGQNNTGKYKHPDCNCAKFEMFRLCLIQHLEG